MKVAAPNIIRAVEMANSLRETLGKGKIEDLPSGSRQNALSCPLARAFNFHCIVSVRHNQWYVSFPSFLSRRAHDAIRGWASTYELNRSLTPGGVRYWLPQDIGEIASDFDGGKLPEYEAR